jgi:hypothetical protein
VKDPRLKFAGQPYLYKIQIQSPALVAEEGEEKEDVCRKFLEEFLPQLQQHLKLPAAA